MRSRTMQLNSSTWRSSSSWKFAVAVRSPARIRPARKRSSVTGSGATRARADDAARPLRAAGGPRPVRVHKKLSGGSMKRLAIWFVMLLASVHVLLAGAETSELRITKQPSIIYLPLVVMEQKQLVEKRATAAGVTDLKVQWLTFNSGGAATDALLAGSVDLVTSGVSNLLLLWERTKGQINGVTSVGGLPMLLVTRDPNVKSLKDFTDKDKIAVPTIKVSSQAMVLKMALEKMYGEKARDSLDAMTVQLGHPDAMIAVIGGSSEVNSHFS